MNKYILRGVIALSLVIFYFLLSLVAFYFLLGWEPVLRMAGVCTVLVLLRLAGLELTRPERAAARRTHQRLTDISAALLCLSFTSIIIFTIGIGVYLYIHFGALTTLFYTVLTLVIAGIFEASYEVFEASENGAE